MMKRSRKDYYKKPLYLLCVAFVMVAGVFQFPELVSAEAANKLFKPSQGSISIPHNETGLSPDILVQPLSNPLSPSPNFLMLGVPLSTLSYQAGTVEWLNPANLRWSQTSAGGDGGAALIRKILLEKGWIWEPVDAVRIKDSIVLIDNTRAAVALDEAVSSVPVSVHKANDLLPRSMQGRFGTATTWGEALNLRTGGQTPKLPLTGTNRPPVLMDTKLRAGSRLAGVKATPTAKPPATSGAGMLGRVVGGVFGLASIYFGVTYGIAHTGELINMIGEDGIGVLGTQKGAATGLRAASDWLLAISGGAAVTAAATSWTGIGGVSFGAIAGVALAASIAAGAAAWLVDGGAKKIAKGVGAAINYVGKAAKSAWQATTNFVGKAANAVSEAATGAWKAVSSVASDAWNGVSSAASNAWNSLWNW